MLRLLAEQSGGFALEEAYLEQFVKLFRNRTAQELAGIREFFQGEIPRTYEILMTMGLDVDALTKKRALLATRLAEAHAQLAQRQPCVKQPPWPAAGSA